MTQTRLFTVRAAGGVVDVFLTPGLEDQGQFVSGPPHSINLQGYTTPEDAATLLHELLHVYDELCGGRLGEQRIRGIERFILALAQDNPQVVQKLARLLTTNHSK
jgi:hypothetical protein